MYIAPVIIQIMGELIQLGGSDIHELVNSVWNKEELPEQWKESIILPSYKELNKID
jgi:hypothetical protein